MLYSKWAKAFFGGGHAFQGGPTRLFHAGCAGSIFSRVIVKGLEPRPARLGFAIEVDGPMFFEGPWPGKSAGIALISVLLMGARAFNPYELKEKLVFRQAQ
jgi:hypothetical protein